MISIRFFFNILYNISTILHLLILLLKKINYYLYISLRYCVLFTSLIIYYGLHLRKAWSLKGCTYRLIFHFCFIFFPKNLLIACFLSHRCCCLFTYLNLYYFKYSIIFICSPSFTNLMVTTITIIIIKIITIKSLFHEN